MLTILHFADLHLGVETYGRPDPATGVSSRASDFLAALDQVIDFALAQDIGLVLFCGDAYRSRDPSQTYQREFARRIKRLSTAGIPLFMVAGNHDMPNAVGRATAVDIFDTLAVENVTVANQASVHRIETRSGVVQIVALPWVRRSALLSREDSRGLGLDEINQRIQQILTDWLDAQAMSLDQGLPTVLTAHVAVANAKVGSETMMTIGRDYTLLQSTVANCVFDYVALGHIHQRQVLLEQPPLVYPGSLQGVDFGDEGLDKGFYVVQLDPEAKRGDRVICYDFHPVSSRRFLTIEATADDDDPTASVLYAIERHEVTDAIVRLQVRVPAGKEGLIRDAEVRKALQDAYFVAAINKDVGRQQRFRLGAWRAETMTPEQALALYLEFRKTPTERVRVLLEYGQKLIQEQTSLE
ncbi:exonuclease SbcCD subunit D [Chloroflexota bacterium]